MSISGVSSSLFNYEAQGLQGGAQQFRQEFQQLGQDLQSGNLTAAQSDFATLQQLGPQGNSTQTAQSGNPIAQELSAAQQAYTSLQQDLEQFAQGNGSLAGQQTSTSPLTSSNSVSVSA
jgi:hypothetical protein